MRLRIAAVQLALFGALLAAPAAASAAETSQIAAGEMHVQVWPGAVPGEAVVINSIELKPSVPLPAVVQIPLIPGGQIDWVGEILGTTTQDPKREYKVKQGRGGQYAEFTISQSRLAQVEMSKIKLAIQGSATSVTVPYTQSVAAPLTGFSVRIPAAVSKVQIQPTPVGEPQRNQSGESLYTLPNKEMKTGETANVVISYATGSAEGSPTAGTGGLQSNQTIGVLLAGIALALLGLFFVLRKQNQP